MTETTLLALKLTDILPQPWWQIPGLILLIVIIVGWLIYRRKQM